jgi:hypothetical protein
MSAKLPPEDQLLSRRRSTIATVAVIVATLAFSVYLLTRPIQGS